MPNPVVFYLLGFLIAFGIFGVPQAQQINPERFLTAIVTRAVGDAL